MPPHASSFLPVMEVWERPGGRVDMHVFKVFHFHFVSFLNWRVRTNFSLLEAPPAVLWCAWHLCSILHYFRSSIFNSGQMRGLALLGGWGLQLNAQTCIFMQVTPASLSFCLKKRAHSWWWRMREEFTLTNQQTLSNSASTTLPQYDQSVGWFTAFCLMEKKVALFLSQDIYKCSTTFLKIS